MKLGKKIEYKLMDLLWVKVKNNNKLTLLPLVYDFNESKFLDIINNVEYVSRRVEDKTANDASIKKYLIPLDVFDEISKKGRIEDVFTTNEIEFVIKSSTGSTFVQGVKRRNGKQGGENILRFNKNVSVRELKKMQKVYSMEFERLENRAAKIQDDDLCK